MAIKSSVLASLALFGSTLAQSVDGSQYNNPTAGPPASYFAAASTVPVAALQSAAAKASTAAKDATYPINGDSGAPKSTIHSDWTNFSEVCHICKCYMAYIRNLICEVYRVLLSFGLQTWM